jgi:hypothetical protein
MVGHAAREGGIAMGAATLRPQVVGYTQPSMKTRLERLKQRGISESKTIDYFLHRSVHELEELVKKGEGPIILSPKKPHLVGPKISRG